MHQGLCFASVSPLLLLLAASCSQRIYYPDSAPSFGFREKGHLKAFVSAKAQAIVSDGPVDEPLSRRSRNAALAADAGYSFAPHLAVYGVYRGVNNTYRGNWVSTGALYNGRRGEGGMVVFGPLGKNSAAEAMVGVGLGNLHCESRDSNFSYALRFVRYSLQGALSVQTKEETFRGYLGMRIAMQQFYDFQSPNPNLRYTIGWDELSHTAPPANVDIRSRPLAVVEPYLGFETGYRWIRFVGQSGFTERLYGPRMGGWSFYATVGVGFQWPALVSGSEANQE